MTGLSLLVLTSLGALIAGTVLRYWDVKIRKQTSVNKDNLSWRQILYSLCFAYPFCAAYVYLENMV
ncbi:MAG: hypothetical protein J7501_18695 [Bdellovibrio sp.]|nr:hypothetical protein [Bdellovibrio sp.]